MSEDRRTPADGQARLATQGDESHSKRTKSADGILQPRDICNKIELKQRPALVLTKVQYNSCIRQDTLSLSNFSSWRPWSSRRKRE